MFYTHELSRLIVYYKIASIDWAVFPSIKGDDSFDDDICIVGMEIH